MKNAKMRKIVSLALAIGITGSLCSLAYFSDKEKINGDLKLTLGTLSSEATKTIKIDGMDIEVPVSDTFVITNNGTLDQKLTIDFKNPSIGNDGLDKIKYSLSFESSENRNIQGYGNGEETLLSLFEKSINLVDLEGNEIVLNEGEIITATLTLNMQRNMPEQYSGKEFKFDLNIGYTQENNK
ncbi:signal peptide protein [Clostridium perfringens]|nr:signal peptide protein [Clostridium perfringens]